MTRYEAIQKLTTIQDSATGPLWPTQFLVDSLAALGLLTFEDKEKITVLSAVDLLYGRRVCIIDRDGDLKSEQLSRPGAAEIIDILTKSGFRITRDK